MIKREEIKEGIKGELDMWLPLDCPQRETRLINITNSVYDKLHKQGAVIRGHEHPRYVGYWAVKPLIEED